MLGIMCYVAPVSVPEALFDAMLKDDLPPELSFCSHELLLSETMEELERLKLIEQDKSKSLLSLRPLVRDRFRLLTSEADNQRFFDNATYLLYETFPHAGVKTGQLYERWAECKEYLQHVLSLRDQYFRLMTKEEPLLPSLGFCRLLKSLTGYLIESGSYQEAEHTIEVTKAAFETLGEEDQDQELYSDLCGLSGLASAHRGLFTAARPWLEQAHQMRAEARPLDKRELSWAEVNLANLKGSAGNYQASLDWQTKAFRTHQAYNGNALSALRPQTVFCQNMGRCKYFVDAHAEAHIWCQMAINMLAGSENWAMRLTVVGHSTYFVRGNVNRAERNLEEAQADFLRAQQVWLKGGQMPNHHFIGACLYKIGCVALDAGDVELSIRNLERSLEMATLHQHVLQGDYARVLYKLSVALSSCGFDDGEAEQRMKEAEAIARRCLGLADDAAFVNEERTYDGLVYILSPESEALSERLPLPDMTATASLDNDVRGWILSFISGIACVFGASVVCVDLLIRKLPGKSNFRIQESNVFLACSLSLSFGVMMFSSLYSMLPEAKGYLKSVHWGDRPAGLLIMGCFIAGFIGIQAVSRFLHQHMPSHVVDCDHTHKDSSPLNDEDGHQPHGHSHFHLGEPYNSASSALPHSRRSRLPSPFAQANHHTHTANGLAIDHASETTPLLPTSKPAAASFRGRGRARTEDVDVPRRPSMLEVQKRVMSFVRDTKTSCDEEGSCYGYSDPCGQECFKHISYRAVKVSRSQTRLRSTMSATHPPHLSTNLDHDLDYADSLVSPMYRTSRATSRDAMLRPPVESVHEDDEGQQSNADAHDHVSEADHNHASCAASHADDVEAQQHHHHVPTNAFLAIGLQTSIAITLHKLPEGFITYATNHANPQLGFNVFMALFVHNITEGFTMCLPLYMALGSRWKAMAWSALLGGLSQPFGAGIAALWFKLASRTSMQPNAVAYGCLFAATSGIMVSVALQLFVEGLSLNHNRNLCMFFGFLGMAILGLSNALFAAH
ncbi:hypothetical protein NHJ13734_004418 [Beauveria thailandica]